MYCLIRICCTAGMIAGVTAAIVHPAFRTTEGALSGASCLPLSVSAACGLMAVLIGPRTWRFVLWLALAIVGQGVALQLIDAGPMVRYQHYQPPWLAASDSPFLLSLLTIQSVLVAGGFISRFAAIKVWLQERFSTWQLALVAVFFILTSATLSRDVSVYLAELVFAGAIQLVNLANVILAVWALPDEVVVRLSARVSRWVHGQSVRWLPWWMAGWVALISISLCWFSYERHPHIPDEVSYLYQARYLSSGMLTMPLPPVPEAFELGLMHYESDRWFSPFPVGWPAVLAVGSLAGLEWLVNPLLAALNVLLCYHLLRRLYGLELAVTAMLLLCVSPWFLFMAMSFMAHMLVTSCALVAAIGCMQIRDRGFGVWTVISGLAIGLLGLARPLDGLIVAALIAGALLLGTASIGRRILDVVSLGAVSMIFGMIGLAYNAHLTGDPLYQPVMAYFDKYHTPGCNALGFGADRGVGWTGLDPFHGHDPLDALINANLNLFATNIELFGWSCGSLLLIFLFAVSCRMQRGDYAWLIVVFSVMACYSLYWFSGGPDFGARYWYLILIPALVLTVRGAWWLAEQCAAGEGSAASARPRILVFLGCLSLLAMINFVPWRAIDKYFHYRGMRPDIRELASDHDFRNSLVVIRGERFPDYSSAAAYNGPDQEGEKPLFVWDRGPTVLNRLTKAYPARKLWLIDGPSMTGNGFRIHGDSREMQTDPVDGGDESRRAKLTARRRSIQVPTNDTTK